MTVAAARAQRCDMLWSEDMDDGRIVEGMRKPVWVGGDAAGEPLGT